MIGYREYSKKSGESGRRMADVVADDFSRKDKEVGGVLYEE